MKKLDYFDPVVAGLIELEATRIEDGLNLIASESYPIEPVMEANGSVFVSKYTEGYAGKRYYGGCEFADELEQTAIERALNMFGVLGGEYICNVQPHAGSQANMAVYMACLELGDTVLGMDLSNGGHLTHGSPVNFSGKLYNFVHYGVDDNGVLDYEEIRSKAEEHRPKLIVCGASAYSRAIDFKKFKEIADSVGALLLADISHIAGLVVAGLHKSPLPYADFVTTTTHKTLLGTRGAIILAKPEWEKKINSAVFPNMQGGALQHCIAGKAVSFKYCATSQYRSIMGNVVELANTMSSTFVKLGVKVVSGGTDNHLMLLDVRSLGLTGKEAERILGDVSIYCNKNTVPNETASPFVTSGIRLGTVSLAQRHFSKAEASELAHIIFTALKSQGEPTILAGLKRRVEELANNHPVY